MKDVRTKLLESAEVSFLDVGYRVTRLSDVAAAAGISKKTVYKLVGTKAALFAAVLENAVMTAVPQLPLASTGDSADIVLRAFIRPFAHLALSERGVRTHRLVLSEAANFPEVARLYSDTVNAVVVAPMAYWLTEQAKAGTLALAKPCEAAQMLLSMIVADPLQRAALGIEPAPIGDVIDARLDRAIAIFLQGTA